MRNNPKRGRKLIKAVKEMVDSCPKCQGTGKVRKWDSKNGGLYVRVPDGKGSTKYVTQPCQTCSIVRSLLQELGL